MNIQTEKIELAKLLLNTNNPKIIQAIKQIFKKENVSDFYDELSQTEKEEIKKASHEVNEGKTIDYNTFLEKHR